MAVTIEGGIVAGLKEKFPYLGDRARVQRLRRIIVDVEALNFGEVFSFVCKGLDFSILCTITGVDEGQSIGLIYHLARPDGIVLNLKFSVPKERPVINTIARDFPNSDIYERELVDLLGVKVEGLPEGNRYPLPDDWPKDEYPLRKDWSMKHVP